MESIPDNVLPWVVDDVFLAPVHINVGGTPYTTTLKTLTRYSDSKIAKLFNRTLPIAIDPVNRGYFLDVDGSVFSHILNFLRYGKLILPDDFNQLQLLKTQAEFFEIKELIEALPDLPDEEGKTIDSEEESVKSYKSRQKRRNKKSSYSEVMVQDGSGDGRKVVLEGNVSETSDVKGGSGDGGTAVLEENVSETSDVKGGSGDGGRAVLERNVFETSDIGKGGSDVGGRTVLERNVDETSDVVIVSYRAHDSEVGDIDIYSLQDIILECPNPGFRIENSICNDFIKHLECTVCYWIVEKDHGHGYISEDRRSNCVIACTLHVIKQLLNKGYTICSAVHSTPNSDVRACEFVLVRKS